MTKSIKYIMYPTMKHICLRTDSVKKKKGFPRPHRPQIISNYHI